MGVPMGQSTDAFHEGERRAQHLAGVEAPSSQFIRPFLTEQHRAFFPALPYLVVGGLDASGWPAATFLSGEPGFIACPDETTLSVTWPDNVTDPVRSGLRRGQPIAVLGIEFGTRRRNRANGLVADIDTAVVLMRVLQSFGNCPQYIRSRVSFRASREPEPIEILDGLDEKAGQIIASASTFFVASYAPSAPHSGMDVSHRGGPSGFVRVDGDRLTVPDYPGNRYFNTFGNFLENPRAGLVFVDFENGDLLHLFGDVDIKWQDDASGAQRAFTVRICRGVRRKAAVPLVWEDGPTLGRSPAEIS
ncbi:pyridoxamine 5'-phosphate oxidase family protein [Gluconacetobacter sacchari]|uniref:pyridoxamine 5'-phosphate oxidase family protein n=1 Tax=Gluconacetobacter sacchari TaxID=92759 RepID=UPI0039B6E282